MTTGIQTTEIVRPNQTKQQARFRTPDWVSSARWIWISKFRDEGTVAPGKFVLFRKTFSLPRGNRRDQFIIHVSADSRYRLFVNEQSVSFGPCKSYPERWYFETVDIAPFLVEGRNVVSARVLRYAPDCAGSSSIVRTLIPGFMLHGIDEVRLRIMNRGLTLNDLEPSRLY
jgi:alpha-L-rhamnosidase